MLSGLFYTRHFYCKRIINKTATVFINRSEKGYTLVRNGKPFYINGSAGNCFFHELHETGGNTVRLYDTLNLQNKLDDALKNNLSVIVDIPIPAYDIYNYSNNEEIKDLKQNVKKLVVKYKNHPALLIWNLGNEINYPEVNWKDIIKGNESKKRFIQNYNELINIIKSGDINHPVSTSKWNIRLTNYISFKIFSPDIDLVSYNIFGDTKNINNNLKKYDFYFGSSPFYISEISSDGWWTGESRFTSWWSPIEQSSSKKAEQIHDRYYYIARNDNCLGSCVFYWGNKYECTHTWYSLFKENCKSEIVLEIENLWKKTNKKPELIGLEYMLIEGMGAYDNLIFEPGVLKNTELVLNVKMSDSIKINWEVYHDVWFQGWNEEKYNKKQLNMPSPINCLVSSQNNTAKFKTPSEEGPYRIFAYVYNNKGYFATVNTPFYVLNPDEKLPKI
jgi:hypothetical protein